MLDVWFVSVEKTRLKEGNGFVCGGKIKKSLMSSVCY